MAVKAPMPATMVMWIGSMWVYCSTAVKSGKQRTTRKTPAETIVAAWMRAETGVGPSIASGSQVWSGNCALLPTVPPKSSNAITAASGNWVPRKPVVARCSSVS